MIHDPYLPEMTLSEINRILKGKEITVEERYFRCLICNIIQTQGVQTLYNTKKFCNYLLSIEQDGSEMFIFLKNRREEFLNNTEDIILKHLLVVE